jgi:isoleucyl-tRNA synthetase
MSKSLGTGIAPQQVMQDVGADVLRLWVALVNVRDEIRHGKEVLARTVEAYRKIRNTFRYLLSYLYDFDPATDALEIREMFDVDRHILSRYARLEATMREAYERYDFQGLAHAVNEFVTVDLSALYLDVSKDRLYTFRANSRERRSAQTAVYAIADGLARLMAPIVPMTADEIWARLPGVREASVHLAAFPHNPESWIDGPLELRWETLARVRRSVNEQLELARGAKEIGAPLTAHVTVTVGDEAVYEILKAEEAGLPMLFIVSGVTLQRSPDQATALEVKVAKAAGEKCPRCWRFVPALTPAGDDERVCPRCEEALRV